MRSLAAGFVALLLGCSSLALADAPPPPPAAKPQDKSDKADKAAKPKKAELMDINTATADQLKTLPGVTDEIAGKIVAGRPYKGKDALLKQKMVDKDAYAKIRDLIIAEQAKKAETAPPEAKAAAHAPPAKAKGASADDPLGGLGGGAPAAAPPSGAH